MYGLRSPPARSRSRRAADCSRGLCLAVRDGHRAHAGLWQRTAWIDFVGARKEAGRRLRVTERQVSIAPQPPSVTDRVMLSVIGTKRPAVRNAIPQIPPPLPLAAGSGGTIGSLCIRSAPARHYI